LEEHSRERREIISKRMRCSRRRKRVIKNIKCPPLWRGGLERKFDWKKFNGNRGEGLR